MKLFDSSVPAPRATRDARLTAINFVADAVNRTIDLKEIADNALHAVLAVTKVDAGAVYMWAEDERALPRVHERRHVHVGDAARGSLAIALPHVKPFRIGWRPGATVVEILATPPDNPILETADLGYSRAGANSRRERGAPSAGQPAAAVIALAGNARSGQKPPT